MHLRDVRPRFPASMPDEEFLLRAVMPEEQVNAMLASRPADAVYNPDSVPLLRALGELKSRPRAARHTVEQAGFKLTLKESADGQAA
jgi:oxaloacetate decarboxylase alpha subunit